MSTAQCRVHLESFKTFYSLSLNLIPILLHYTGNKDIKSERPMYVKVMHVRKRLLEQDLYYYNNTCQMASAVPNSSFFLVSTD